MHTRISENTLATCPACMAVYHQKREWQRFCSPTCKHAWEAVFRDIGHLIANKLIELRDKVKK